MNRVICLHAPKDVGAARDLGRHLAAARRASLLQLWTLDDVAPGEPTGDHVHTQLRLADVFILLLSSEYFADEACARWLALAMQERERRGALLLPVMLRATTLHGSALQGLATLPHNRVPVCQWRARAAAWAEIADVAMGAIEARPIAPAPAQRQWLVPERLVRNRYFTGRHALIEQLNTHMEAPGGSCLLVLHGLGGAGKTQVALELAHQRAAGTATVLWLDATSRDCLLESLREIADRGSPRGAWVPAQVPDVLRWLRRFLEEQRRCLLILDGLEDLALWQEIAPVLGRAGVLVTTRHSDYERLSGAAISAPVPPFTTEEAVRFIAARLGRGDLPAGEADAARALAAELGLLPLALEQAASHLVAHHRPVREYLASLATAPLEVLEQSGPRTGGYARTVATTWRINIADAAAASSESAALLRWLAIMAPAPVPLSLLTAAGANPGDPSDALGAALARGAADRAALDSLIYPLLRHSLIERDPVEGVLRLNRVVQMAVRHELPLPAQQAAVRRLVLALGAAFPEPAALSWRACQQLVPHVLAASEHLALLPPGDERAGALLLRAGRYLTEMADLTTAGRLLTQALAVLSAASGPGMLAEATALRHLANLRYQQRELDEAERDYRRALALSAGAGGKGEGERAAVLNNLAGLLQEQQRYEEAEQLLLSALSLKERLFGPASLQVAHTLHNLGRLAHCRGALPEAERHYKRALRLKRATLSAGHPAIASTLGNLGRLHLEASQHALALRRLTEAMEIRDACFGREHPATAATLIDLAQCELEAGRAERGLHHYREAEEVLVRAHGPDHPEVLMLQVRRVHAEATIPRVPRTTPDKRR